MLSQEPTSPKPASLGALTGRKQWQKSAEKIPAAESVSLCVALLGCQNSCKPYAWRAARMSAWGLNERNLLSTLNSFEAFWTFSYRLLTEQNLMLNSSWHCLGCVLGTGICLHFLSFLRKTLDDYLFEMNGGTPECALKHRQSHILLPYPAAIHAAVW